MSKISFLPINKLQKQYSTLRGRILCICGPPGSGKTTTGTSIEKYLKELGMEVKYFPEEVDKNLLSAYFANPEKYGFILQFIMVKVRICAYREAIAYCKTTGGFAIMDGNIHSDPVFEQLNYEDGNISNDDHHIYIKMLEECERLPTPDYVLYCSVTPETARRRLAKRGNISELIKYTEDYYKRHRKLSELTLEGNDVSVIDYNKDVIMDDKFIYNLLDKIISRQYEVTSLQHKTITEYF